MAARKDISTHFSVVSVTQVLYIRRDNTDAMACNFDREVVCYGGKKMTPNSIEEHIRVRIRNIGKLRDAEIHVGQFTVFAGTNSTGKSSVSKLLYSFFSATNPHPGETYLYTIVQDVCDNLKAMVSVYEEDEDEAPEISMYGDYSTFRGWLGRVKSETAKLQSLGDVEYSLSESIAKLANQVDVLIAIFSEMHFERTKKKRRRRDIGSSIYDDFSPSNVKDSLKKLKEKLQISPEQSIVNGLSLQIRKNLVSNFQIPNASDLIGSERHLAAEVEIGDFGTFCLLKNKEVQFVPNDNKSLLERLQYYKRHSDVIYLESPIHWKVKNALTQDRYLFFSSIGRRRQPLTGVPGYFRDLVRKLETIYTGDMDFSDIYAELTGEDVIGGKIALSETGVLSFQENNRNFPLPVTATGITNLGMLALLIERKVLNKGTFLFIDEPEAHLHPSWQIFMVKNLFALSQQGVNVVIATHSVDILKWLSVHIKNNPEDMRRVALNHFDNDNTTAEDAEDTFEEKMDKIMYELTKPFSDLYIEGI